MIAALPLMKKNTIYINESGLYSLVLRSNKEESKQFKKWITSEVLPSIRKTGQYSTALPTHNQLSILNETDLHHCIIKFIRNNFHDPIIIAGLGENQISSNLRINSWKKGYAGGQPDIMVLNTHKHFNGIAIELKTPKGNGIINDSQQIFLNKLKDNNYKIIVSNDYTHILMELLEYQKYLMYNCKYCIRYFYSNEKRNNHYKYFRRNYNMDI